jgi:hypothetical protein
MTDLDISHPLTYTCDVCDRDVPRNDVCRLLHLLRKHPHKFHSVEEAYLDEVAALNDVTRKELRREGNSPGAELIRLAQRAAVAVDS